MIQLGQNTYSVVCMNTKINTQHNQFENGTATFSEKLLDITLQTYYLTNKLTYYEHSQELFLLK